MELAKRNFKEIWLDPVLLGVTIALPPVLLIVLQALGAAIGDEAPQLSATMLAPGIALFGFVMLMFSAALTLAKDRETAFLARLLTTPVTAGQFIAAYSIPYLPIAILQAAMMFAIAYFGGLENHGNPGLVILALLIMAVCYVALGMIMGSLLTVNQNSVAYTLILLLTIFGGTWMDVEAIGGVFNSVAQALPFAHALGAARDVMQRGAGLGDIAADLLWVLGYTVVAVAAAVLVFRRRMVE